MERRREPRYPAQASAVMTLLDGSGTRLDAVAVELSRRGMRLAVDHPIAPGTPVRIETPEALYLAEVCHAAPLPNRQWQIGLKVDQVLSGWADVARLRQFLELDMPLAPDPQPVHCDMLRVNGRHR